MGLVPGINDLVRGIPWPKGISTSLKPISRRPNLESFEESGFKSFCDSGSNTATVESFQDSPTPSSHTEVENHILQMPNYASVTQGGWMDTSSWFFNLLWKEVKDFSLDDLYNVYFTREYRREYGENHAINRKARPEMLDKAADGKKRTAKENHGEQERLRRERHRFLQKEADNTIPTWVFNMARKIMHLVKAQAKNEARLVSVDNAITGDNRKARLSSSEKLAGKDDQLTAAVMAQHLASILICRQHERIVEQHDRIAKLEEKIAFMSQQQLLHEERERELPFRSGTARPTPAVLHDCKGIKRALYEVEKPTTMISQQPLTSPHPMKRQRHLPKPTMHFNVSHNGTPGPVPCLLPPSPTPSHDGCGSYFFCGK